VRLYRLVPDRVNASLEFHRWAWWERVCAVNNFYEGWIHFEA
jgi:hypothetical protein